LLAATPDDAILARLRAITADDNSPQGAMTLAWCELNAAAQQAQASDLAAEYHNLFIGLGRGELVPYGSWYLTGFLMEKPLVRLRRDLATLGYQRPENVHEPEDHAAALCEVMAMLIRDATCSPESQRQFFDTHLGSWMETFFTDLQGASNACFYRAVGCLGQTFITLEKQYLNMLV
jgi:TorA maturation chaperone TorD